MAALTIRQPLGSIDWPVAMDLWTMAAPQGAEDKQLRENAHSAVEHWKSRTEYLLSVDTTVETHVSVPFEHVKKVRVTYRHVGALKPAPYPLDE